MTTINSTLLPFVHAEGDDINFDKIEREVDLAFELKRARADYEKTRAALEAQTAATQLLHHERQVERALLAHPGLSPKAVVDVTALVLRGDAGELDTNKHGRLVEKYGTRSLEDLTQDYLKANPHFTGNSSAESAHAGAPKLYKSEMSAKQIADYVDAHGRDAFHALPREKPPLKK